MSGPPGRRPRKDLSRRINETPPSQQEGMAWRHGSTGSVFCVLPLPQDGSFSANRWRKTNLRRGKRTHGRTFRFSPRARGFAGRKGMTVMAMETGMGTTEPRQASADRCAARPRSFFEPTEKGPQASVLHPSTQRRPSRTVSERAFAVFCTSEIAIRAQALSRRCGICGSSTRGYSD